MLRKIGYGLAFGAAGAGLAVVGWPGAPGSPATLINRVDVITIPVLLAALPWVGRRRFGPVGDSWPVRILRAGGFLAVFALVLVKARVERFEYAALPGRPWLAGLWAGEIGFLVVTGLYVAGLLAVTARRPPAAPAALAIGTGAGAVAGLVVFALPPVGNPLHVTKSWLAVVHGLGWGVAVPLVLAGSVVAGLAAARRASSRGGRLPLADVRTRQGVAAGLCAGAAAALLVSLAGISAAALQSHQATRFSPGAASQHPVHIPAGLYDFEVSLGDSAAGYLLVLVFFPLLGAGLGAWGGLCAADRPGRQPGDGGGGGGGFSDGPPPPPPPGGRRLDEERQPAILSGYLFELPGLAGLPQTQEDEHAAPGRRERAPAGTAGTAGPPRARQRGS